MGDTGLTNKEKQPHSPFLAVNVMPSRCYPYRKAWFMLHLYPSAGG